MSTHSGPNIVENGLVLSLDPANQKSYSPNMFPYSTDIFSWTQTAGVNNGTQSRDTSTESPIGNSPVKLVVSGNDSHFVTYNSGAWNFASAKNGETWTVSVYVKATIPTPCQIFIFGANSAGTGYIGGSWLAITAQNHNASTEWTRVSTSITMANADIANIQFRLDGPDSYVSPVTLWFDGVQVEKNNTPTTFNPNYYGNVLRDISGIGNNGTIFNSPNFSASNAGSLAFNGTNTYISIPHNDSITPTNAITVEAWASLPNWNIASDLRIISKTEGGNYQIGLNDAGYSGEVGGTIMVNGVYRPVGYSRSLVSAGWHQLILSFDGRYVNFYLDSVLRDTVDCGSMLTMNVVNNHLVIGAEPGAGTAVAGAYFHGNIGSCKIYNRALSLNEIKNNFNALRGRYGI